MMSLYVFYTDYGEDALTNSKIPTYSEIASFKETLLKSKKQLDQEELKAMHETLVHMEFTCLRAISTLSHRTDMDLMRRARQGTSLEHKQYQTEAHQTPLPAKQRLNASRQRA